MGDKFTMLHFNPSAVILKQCQDGTWKPRAKLEAQKEEAKRRWKLGAHRLRENNLARVLRAKTAPALVAPKSVARSAQDRLCLI